MPLSPPAERHLTHLRDIVLRGYERADGLFDIEAHIRDTKTLGLHLPDRGGWIEPGEPLHDMWLRVTIDEDMTIRGCEAVTEQGPFSICQDGARHFDPASCAKPMRGSAASTAARICASCCSRSAPPHTRPSGRCACAAPRPGATGLPSRA